MICILLSSVFSFAQTTLTLDEIEIRAREVGRSLRCVVCQNQSIEESDASLAKDMRVLVRERIALGDSDAEIIEFMRLRYGDYVLLKPPFQHNTLVLWALPALIIFGMGLWLLMRTRNNEEGASFSEVLSEKEQGVLKRLMDEKS